MSTSKRTVKRYGWKRDLPDSRDFKFYGIPQVVAILPPKIDLRPRCPWVIDQGNLGSCTANAIANAHLYDQMKQKAAPHFLPSRLFIYYNEREIEGTISEDSGASIRDGFHTINEQGVCPEKEWPYIISKFTQKPSTACYTHALNHQALVYRSVQQDLTQMKACLAQQYPFVFGFSVYESFESATVAKTGVVPMPGRNEELLGGHAVLCVGYDDTLQRFIVENSWGTRWGMKGFFTIPYAYLTDPDLADDFWVVNTVEID